MKKILVLCQNYPSEQNPFTQIFIHYRLKEYIKEFDVRVVSFASKDEYTFEGVKVYGERQFNKKFKVTDFDVVISHAPNVRNHQRFILFNLFSIKKIILIFHGYEVIDIHKRIYDQPTIYSFPLTYSLTSKLYHRIKLPLTRFFLMALDIATMCRFIFVSNVLLEEASEDLKCKSLFQKNTNTFVINNPINPLFHKSSFTSSKKYDFICIRPFNDPKYGVDIFIKIAEKNPQFTFHLYGRGIFPEVSEIPKNLVIFETFIKNDDLPGLLIDYKAAILPTRWDSQGVLACEIAAFGMPLITSDLGVCREMLSQYKNVTLVHNTKFHELDLNQINLNTTGDSENLYSHERTTNSEINVLKNFFAQQGNNK